MSFTPVLYLPRIGTYELEITTRIHIRGNIRATSSALQFPEELPKLGYARRLNLVVYLYLGYFPNTDALRDARRAVFDVIAGYLSIFPYSNNGFGYGEGA